MSEHRNKEGFTGESGRCAGSFECGGDRIIERGKRKDRMSVTAKGLVAL